VLRKVLNVSLGSLQNDTDDMLKSAKQICLCVRVCIFSIRVCIIFDFVLFIKYVIVIMYEFVLFIKYHL
jgi:hypothetical protein